MNTLHSSLALATISLVILSSCGGCDDTKLIDTTCRPGTKPGDKAVGDPTDAPEICGNGLDDNCNGEVDEGCECADGTTMTCGVESKYCHYQTTVMCVGGHFPGCVPTGYPSLEICDGQDNDCNDLIDEQDPGLVISHTPCWDGADQESALAFADTTTTAKTSSISICLHGHFACEGGAVVCLGAVYPQQEICNGLDDDCDGTMDNNIPGVGDPCGPPIEQGICHKGKTACNSQTGEYVCPGAIYRAPRACNGMDNDCDGIPDSWQLLPLPCANRQCNTSGFQRCTDTGWSACDARGPASEEICDNNIDDNCNGAIDEGCPCHPGASQLCFTNVVGSPTGADCGLGFALCDDNGMWGPCNFHQTTREQCNNHDDDCDGVVDNFTESCGNPALNGIGECRSGIRTCTAGQYTDCNGLVPPKPEICDQEDNDCNGLVDDGLPPPQDADIIFAIDISGSMGNKILALTMAVQQFSGRFVGSRHRFAAVTFPGHLGYNASLHRPPVFRNILDFLTMPPLVDVGVFQSGLGNVTDDGGGWEPSLDVLLKLTSAVTSSVVGYRRTAHLKIFVLITDEEPQSFIYNMPGMSLLDEAMLIANQTQACQLPGCLVPDCLPPDCTPMAPIETYIMTEPEFFSSYMAIVNNDPTHLLPIEPIGAIEYENELANIVLKDVCTTATTATSSAGMHH